MQEGPSDVYRKLARRLSHVGERFLLFLFFPFGLTAVRQTSESETEAWRWCEGFWRRVPVCPTTI